MAVLGKKRTGYVAHGNQRTIVQKSITFNIDNGAGTTADDVICNLPYEAYLVDVRAVYTEATDSSGVESANFKLGVAVGGATLVGATALEVSKAIGDTTTSILLVDVLPANTTLWVRHTGVATTDVGQYYIQVTLLPKP